MARQLKASLGPLRKDWKSEPIKGNCPDCGGECEPECGLHPAGCVYGGFTENTAYWLIVEGCEKDHGGDKVVANG